MQGAGTKMPRHLNWRNDDGFRGGRVAIARRPNAARSACRQHRAGGRHLVPKRTGAATPGTRLRARRCTTTGNARSEELESRTRRCRETTPTNRRPPCVVSSRIEQALDAPHQTATDARRAPARTDAPARPRLRGLGTPPRPSDTARSPLRRPSATPPSRRRPARVRSDVAANPERRRMNPEGRFEEHLEQQRPVVEALHVSVLVDDDLIELRRGERATSPVGIAIQGRSSPRTAGQVRRSDIFSCARRPRTRISFQSGSRRSSASGTSTQASCST